MNFHLGPALIITASVFMVAIILTPVRSIGAISPANAAPKRGCTGEMGPDCPPVYRCPFGYICFYDGDPRRERPMVRFSARQSECQGMKEQYRNRTSYIVNHSPNAFYVYHQYNCKNGSFQNTGYIYPYSKGWMSPKLNNIFDAARSNFVINNRVAGSVT